MNFRSEDKHITPYTRHFFYWNGKKLSICHLAFLLLTSQYLLLRVPFVSEGHNIRWRLFITLFSSYRDQRELALMPVWCRCLIEQLWPVIKQTSALATSLGKPGTLLMESSVLFLMFLMTVGVAHCFLLICGYGFSLSRRLWDWCGFAIMFDPFFRQGVCVLIAFSTTVPRNPFEGNDFGKIDVIFRSWIDLTQGRDYWRALVNMSLKLQLP